MVLHIMGNKRRIPRKVKKALKYTFLYPRVGCLRHREVYIVKRNSKWIHKAVEIKRQIDYSKIIAEQLKDLL